MEATNESVNVEVSFQCEAFVAFEKGFRWFEVEEVCNSIQLLMSEELCDLAAKNIWGP